jgi:hypothetical protein
MVLHILVHQSSDTRQIRVCTAHALAMRTKRVSTILAQEYLRLHHGVSFAYPAGSPPTAFVDNGTLMLVMRNQLPHLHNLSGKPPSASLANNVFAPIYILTLLCGINVWSPPAWTPYR